MLFLIIDTCTERGAIGLFKDTYPIALQELPIGLSNSSHLMPAIDQLFRTTGIHKEKLTFIGIGVGPGSYTGIRVGAAVAEGLSMALGIPLVPISTLWGLTPDGECSFFAALDAKIGGVFVAHGVQHSGNLEFQEPKCLAIGEFCHSLQQVSCIVTTHRDWVDSRLTGHIDLERFEIITKAPDLKELAKFCLKFFKNKIFYNGDQVLPIYYLRKTQAEIEQEEKQRQ